MSNEVHPWKWNLSHPLASVLIEVKPLIDPKHLASDHTSPQSVSASILTDHPLLNEAIQVGIAIISVALPLIIAGFFGDPPPPPNAAPDLAVH